MLFFRKSLDALENIRDVREDVPKYIAISGADLAPKKMCFWRMRSPFLIKARKTEVPSPFRLGCHLYGGEICSFRKHCPNKCL